ncbi:Bacteriophage replication gene A protein (GPA) [Variovorax sp. PBL-H6]|uniref:replication endonuclease n=1 Tax=Variovorax sp. PBL-H6 TaxID=434009 RepID=UPI001317D021|nr:replication endonuclease [Variovorax sp. PBL-H6]VTU15659.1 Bacteriophage replication gene A protein (GPA) [Variovorax sp. PBL-H6]
MPSPSPTPLSAAIARAKHDRAASAFSPLHPFLPEPDAELHPRQAAQLKLAHAEAQAWEAELLRDARGVQRYLGWNYGELCDEARSIPARLRALASLGSRREFDPQRLVAIAERVFKIQVPGKTQEAKVARVLDGRYWRLALWKRIGQAKEHLHLKLGLIGKGARAYCSADALTVRSTQLKRQQQWLKETVLRADIDGERVELPLEAVAKSPRQKLARLYAFIAAMDQLAMENSLTVTMLTATLEGPWHANPTYAGAGHRWNGKTPGEASKELGARFQRVRRDLDKKGIAISGLWAAEPHKDACPHRHFWLIYAPQHERSVLAAFLGHFPGKLKLRRDAAAGGDVMFDDRADALAGRARPLAYEKEGAQVDVVVIDRTKSSGASYALKYVSKAIGAELAFDGEGDPDDATAPTEKQRELQKTLQAVDAYRSVWRMRSCQFFGIRNSLSLWDELRRMKEPPEEMDLRALWRAARGGDAKGSVSADVQRGDACAFLKLQGGLAAAPKAEQRELDDEAPQPQARVYRTPTLTQYGETGTRIAGVELVEPGKEEAVLERVATRQTRWTLAPKEKAKGKGKKPGTSPAKPMAKRRRDS